MVKIVKLFLFPALKVEIFVRQNRAVTIIISGNLLNPRGGRAGTSQN